MSVFERRLSIGSAEVLYTRYSFLSLFLRFVWIHETKMVTEELRLMRGDKTESPLFAVRADSIQLDLYIVYSAPLQRHPPSHVCLEEA